MLVQFTGICSIVHLLEKFKPAILVHLEMIGDRIGVYVHNIGNYFMTIVFFLQVEDVESFLNNGTGIVKSLIIRSGFCKKRLGSSVVIIPIFEFNGSFFDKSISDNTLYLDTNVPQGVYF